MRLAAAALALILAACLAAPLYATHVSGRDAFRTNVLGVITVDGAPTPVLAEAPGGLGTVPLGPVWHGGQGVGPYVLGADALGRDIAALVLFGGRTSLLVAAVATLLCMCAGAAAGVLAGGLGGRVDLAVSAVLDLLWAFPVTLLAISLALVWVGQAGGLAVTIAVLGVVYVPYVARPVRASLAALRDTPLMEAARAVGGGPLHVLWRHALPQVMPVLLGLMPVVAAMALLTEATLSALGLGVQPPAVSWGTLILDGQALLHQRPWAVVAPGAAVAVTVLALNAVAEGMRAAG